MAEISGLSNSEVNELCKPADPATKVCLIAILSILIMSPLLLIFNHFFTSNARNDCRLGFFLFRIFCSNKRCTALKIHAHRCHSTPVYWAWHCCKNWILPKQNSRYISWAMKTRTTFQLPAMPNAPNGPCHAKQRLNWHSKRILIRFFSFCRWNVRCLKEKNYLCINFAVFNFFCSLSNWGTESNPDQKYHDGNSDPRGFGHIGIMVPDVDAACERFESLGVTFVKRPNDGRMKGLAFIKDPDGYWIEIFNANTVCA